MIRVKGGMISTSPHGLRQASLGQALRFCRPGAMPSPGREEGEEDINKGWNMKGVRFVECLAVVCCAVVLSLHSVMFRTQTDIELPERVELGSQKEPPLQIHHHREDITSTFKLIFWRAEANLLLHVKSLCEELDSILRSDIVSTKSLLYILWGTLHCCDVV